MNTNINASAAGQLVLGTDLKVNRLGFGAMRITGRGIWGDPPDIATAVRVLQRAVRLGVTFIDTADSYGPEVSESLIARALYPYSPDIVVATKGGLVRPGPDVWNHDASPEHLRKACEASGIGSMSISCMRPIPRCRSRTRSVSSCGSRAKARSGTSECRTSTSASYSGASGWRPSSPSRTVTTSRNATPTKC